MYVTANCSIDPLSLSFGQLKALVGKTTGKTLPSLDELYKADEAVLFTYETAGVTVTVFSNGWILRESNGGDEIYAVDRCRQIYLRNADGVVRNIPQSEFSGGPCLIPLFIAGIRGRTWDLDDCEFFWQAFVSRNHSY